MAEHNNNRDGILLESGINEVEVMEFYLEDQSFGINVAKVRQLVQYEDGMVTRLPDAPKEILGTTFFRGESVTVIDLNTALNRKDLDEKPPRQLLLITEFNNRVTAFLVHGVNRIHRVSWKALQPLGYTPTKDFASNFIGSISLNERDILVLDLERLLAKIDPEAGFKDYEPPHEDHIPKTREEVKLVFAEDSNYIRELITDSMKKVGYVQVETFKNGQDTYEYLRKMKLEGTLTESVDLILTDIEMPQMDGLTLCKRFKNEISLDIPVIIFSSLINEQMALKCKEVGADEFLTKPQIKELIQAVDRFCLNK